MTRRLVIYLCLAFSITNAFAQEKGEISYLDNEHTLIDKIWHVPSQQYVSQQALQQALLNADYIVLGESHDNPKHHFWQNWALQNLIQQQRKPSVAFEMIDDTQLAKITPDTITTSDALFDALDWEKSGWPKRELYADIFTTVLDNQLSYTSANLPRESLREVISKATPPSEEIKQLLDERPLTDAEQDSMLKELEESHCNMLPKQHVAGMITGQRVRDAVMAISLLRQTTPAVLIAGKAHGRLDRGAPSFLLQRQPEAKIVSIGWHEVQADRPQPNDYADIWQSDTLPFDYVWFTARVDRPDPCDEIKAFLNKKREKDASKKQDAQ